MSPGYPIFFVGLEKCICVYQDQAVAAIHENKYRMATNSLISGVTDRNLANKLCSKSNRWTSASKLRQNMTEVLCKT